MPDLPDLGALNARPLTPEAQAEIEFREGMRCGGCRERIAAGYEFVRFSRGIDPKTGTLLVRADKTYACSREECTYRFAAVEHSVAMRQVQWLFLDSPELRGSGAEATPPESGGSGTVPR